MVLAWLVLLSHGAGASSEVTDFDAGREALGQGDFNLAIASFERLSDRGFVQPSASFNRGLAYLQRAESPKRKPGDLGQAAAGFREATRLSGDGASEQALLDVRREIARRRAQLGLDPVIAQATLRRALVQLVPEQVLILITGLASLVLCAGLVLRRRQYGPSKLAGQVMTFSGLGFVLIAGVLTLGARHYRSASQEAIVIVAAARMLDDRGQVLKTKAVDLETTRIPEGSSVFAEQERGRLVRIRWGASDAWLRATDIRRLASP